MINPFQVLKQVLPQARTEDELINLAANLAPPPPADFRPQTGAGIQGGVMPMQGMPQSPMVPKTGPMMVPPMTSPKTQGESRTSIGEHLVGGGY